MTKIPVMGAKADMTMRREKVGAGPLYLAHLEPSLPAMTKPLRLTPNGYIFNP